MNSDKCKLRDCRDVSIEYKVNPKFFGTGGSFSNPNLNEKIKEFSVKQGTIIIKGEQGTICFITASSEIIKKIEIEICDCIGRPIRNIEEIEI